MTARGPFLQLGECAEAVRSRLEAWDGSGFAGRLWRKDEALWKECSAAADWLGWLALPETSRREAEGLEAFAREAWKEGVRHAILLGMGGSSLAAEVMARTYGRVPGAATLALLDSTHPRSVREASREAPIEETMWIVSSKSGTTTETLSFFRYFWARAREREAEPGGRFVAVTDPGSPLARLAGEHQFRRTFEAPPDVGGRYSALSAFGLVPAAIAGVDLRDLTDRAARAAGACGPESPASRNPALVLGAALGELARAGRDKATFLVSRTMKAFPQWVEQLIAESTGKEGVGIVPVVDEPAGPPEVYGRDRAFFVLTVEGDDSADLLDRVSALREAGHPVVRIHLADRHDLGAEFFRWEAAVAAAGSVLGINPFDQPDVELAKRLAREAMSADGEAEEGDAGRPVDASDPAALGEALASLLGSAKEGDYIALQAYLPVSAETDFALRKLRLLLRDRTRLATTLGFGPRFLHSTGQLHKGGPDTGLFLQITDRDPGDVPVPGQDYTFRRLLSAQAAGDASALRQRGRRLLRVSVGEEPAHGLAHLLAAIR